jgi:hypothetical protein
MRLVYFQRFFAFFLFFSWTVDFGILDILTPQQRISLALCFFSRSSSRLESSKTFFDF